MSYNYYIPKPNDIPKTNQPQFLSNFMSLNNQFGGDHIPFGNLAEGATLTSPCVITSENHLLSTGDSVTITHFAGYGENGTPMPWSINGNTYTVTVLDANNFSIPVDTSAFLEYIPNSGDWSSSSINYGYHQQLRFASALPRSPDNFYRPNLNPPAASVWPGYVDGLGQLFYQNSMFAAGETQLTQIPITTTNMGQGFVTPWGFTVNCGYYSGPFVSTYTITFPVPYKIGTFFTAQATSIYRVGVNIDSISTTQITLLARGRPGYYMVVGI